MGASRLVPNDYVQIGDDGCCCCCVVVVGERCDAVCPSGQPPPNPSLGISPLRALRPPGLVQWDCLRLPSLVLPAWDTQHTHMYTHTSYLSCVFYLLMFRVAHWLGVLTSGTRGGWFLGGPKKGRECLEGNWGVTVTPGSLQEQLLPPSQGPIPSPQGGSPRLQ